MGLGTASEDSFRGRRAHCSRPAGGVIRCGHGAGGHLVLGRTSLRPFNSSFWITCLITFLIPSLILINCTFCPIWAPKRAGSCIAPYKQAEERLDAVGV